MKFKELSIVSKVVGTAAALAFALSANSALAATYTYDGVITVCNPALCPLVPIAVGDPVVGTINFPAEPGESFDLDVDPGTDTFTDYAFLVGGVIPVLYPAISGEPPELNGVYINGAGSIAPDGSLSGTLTGSFVGGTLGGLGTVLAIDLATGAFEVIAGGGTIAVASVEGAFSPAVIPVPAAAWLFGSALLGLVGVSRKKAKA